MPRLFPVLRSGRLRAALGVAALGFAASACTITADDFIVDFDPTGDTPSKQVVRLTLSNGTSFEGNVRWQVFAGGVSGDVLAEGEGAANEVVDIDVTTLLAAAADGALSLAAVAYLDIDSDDTQHPLEPTAVVEGWSIAVTEGFATDYDSSGTLLAIYANTLVLLGEAGSGTAAAPLALPAHAWTAVSAFTNGYSYLRFTADEAGEYIFVARETNGGVTFGQFGDGSATTIISVANDADLRVAAQRTSSALAAGDTMDLMIIAGTPPSGGGIAAIRNISALALRMPDEGANAAHAVIDSDDFGLGGLEVFDFSAVTTAYESANTRWIDGTSDKEIVFARSKEGDELNDPRLVWRGYRYNSGSLANAADFEYISGDGQVFSSQPFGQCTSAKGGDETVRTDSTPAGYYSAIAWVFTSCDMSALGFDIYTTAVFRR